MDATPPGENLPAMLDLDPRDLDGQTVRLSTDRSFWNYQSSFGGWVAAVIVELLQRHPDFRGEVITQQMQFMGPVAGDEIDVRLQLLARRSSLDFWRAEVHDLDGALLIAADLTCGFRQATEIGYENPAPDIADRPGVAMELTEMHPTWTAHFDQVMIDGEPFTVNERPRSVVRIRPTDDVAFDAGVLAMVCDTPMPRTFFASTDFTFPSTVSLSTHTYASDEQIAAVGREFVVVETDSAVIRNNTLNQELRVYRHDGLLLACSYQTAVFRPATN